MTPVLAKYFDAVANGVVSITTCHAVALKVTFTINLADYCECCYHDSGLIWEIISVVAPTKLPVVNSKDDSSQANFTVGFEINALYC